MNNFILTYTTHCIQPTEECKSDVMLLQVAMDRERGEKASLESQLRDAKREVAELQARYDAHSAELNARYVWNKS